MKNSYFGNGTQAYNFQEKKINKDTRLSPYSQTVIYIIGCIERSP